MWQLFFSLPFGVSMLGFIVLKYQDWSILFCFFFLGADCLIVVFM